MIIIGTSDVGPAKYLEELCEHLDKDIRCIVTPHPTSHILPISQVIGRSIGAKLVVTGTSLGWELDKELIQWAKLKKIPCVSIIEHWSWYKKRFEWNGSLLLPDRIIVNDEIAKSQAIEDGLPPELLWIGGNPWLEKLSKETETSFDSLKWKQGNGLPQGNVAVFISESLYESFPPESSDYLGYDEFIALNQLLEVLPTDFSLAIKPHPEEPEGKYNDYCSERVCVLKSCSVQELAQGAEIVVGMASMLLIELAMFRGDVISFRPNARKKFIGAIIGATHDSTSKAQLAMLLKEPIEISNFSFREQFEGSGRRISEFLKRLMWKK